jgi:peptidyl-prolyl cis-trans isomerase A (cyclophilin A)
MRSFRAPMKALTAVAILLAAALAGCAAPQTPTGSGACAGQSRSAHPAVPAGHTLVALATDKGCLVAELYDDKAPITVANFKQYAAEGFYSDLVFHRVMAGFMSQTGGSWANGTFKPATHAAIHNEAAASGLKNLRYTLSMARLGPRCQGCPDQPDSATNQFFVNAADNAFLDAGAGKAGYAVFGIVTGGRDVADAINAVPVHACPGTGESSCPDQPLHLVSAQVLA